MLAISSKSYLALTLLFLLKGALSLNIILNNDDGFASIQIREAYRALTAAGHNGESKICLKKR
jgi:hypothetical protein